MRLLTLLFAFLAGSCFGVGKPRYFLTENSVFAVLREHSMTYVLKYRLSGEPDPTFRPIVLTRNWDSSLRGVITVADLQVDKDGSIYVLGGYLGSVGEPTVETEVLGYSRRAEYLKLMEGGGGNIAAVAAFPDSTSELESFRRPLQAGQRLGFISKYTSRGLVATTFGESGTTFFPLGFTRGVTSRIAILPDGRLLVGADCYENFDKNIWYKIVSLHLFNSGGRELEITPMGRDDSVEVKNAKPPTERGTRQASFGVRGLIPQADGQVAVLAVRRTRKKDGPGSLHVHEMTAQMPNSGEVYVNDAAWTPFDMMLTGREFLDFTTVQKPVTKYTTFVAALNQQPVLVLDSPEAQLLMTGDGMQKDLSRLGIGRISGIANCNEQVRIWGFKQGKPGVLRIVDFNADNPEIRDLDNLKIFDQLAQ